MKINLKDMSLYSNNTVFLVSDKNWKDVLPLVSLTTWTKQNEDNSECQYGFQTAEKTCVYPTLIWHDERYRKDSWITSESYDIDAIIDFLQKYEASKIYIVGDTPSSFDDVLISQEPMGIGLDEENLIRISSEEYIKFWKDFNDIVYVEDNYSSALVASEYAALLNAPLIISETDSYFNNNFYGKNIICVGNVSPMYEKCDENYNYKELQEVYIKKTNTKKTVITSYNDLDVIESYYSWLPKLERSTGGVGDLVTKTSLISPFLASAKHEVLVPIKGGDPEIWTDEDVYKTDKQIEEEMERLFNIKSLLSKEKDNYLEDFYITIVSSPESIDYSVNSSWLNEIYENEYYLQRSADQYVYSNFDNATGGMPNVNIGRIFGLTSSDYSSLVERTLFYDRIQKEDRASFIVTSVFEWLDKDSIPNVVKKWYEIFSEVHEYSSYTKSYYYADIYNFTAPLWKNNNIISFNDHGGYSFGGIFTFNLPKLDNTVMFENACSTCSPGLLNGNRVTAGPSEDSFCATSIRYGAVAYVGAVSVAIGINPLYKDVMNNIYYYNMSLGQAFNLAYRESAVTGKEYTVNYLENNKIIMFGEERQMITVLGDPTLYLGTKLNKRKMEGFW
jgi:hypothetical protein